MKQQSILLVLTVAISMSFSCSKKMEQEGNIQVAINEIELPGSSIDLTLKVNLYAGIFNKIGYKDCPALKAEFGLANFGIALNKQGEVFVADSYNNCIRKIAGGVVSTFAGNGDPGYVDGQGIQARFDGPQEMAIDSKGNLFVSDSRNNRIRKITPQGVVSTYAGSGESGTADGPSSLAQIYLVGGLAVDTNDHLYFSTGDRIRRIMPVGFLRFVSTVTGGEDNKGFVNGTLAQAKFHYVRGLAFDSQGNLLVADVVNNAIRKITPSGIVSTLCGGTKGFQNGTGTNAKFFRPMFLAIDAADNIYVTDCDNNCVRKVTQAATVTTYAGSGNSGYKNGPALQAEFLRTDAIAINSHGTLYVSETGTQVRKIYY